MLMKSIFSWESDLNFTDILQVVVAIVNIWFVVLVYKLTRKDINPKLYVTPLQYDVGSEFSKLVNEEILEINFKEEGFPMIRMEKFKLWELSLANSSDLPATKIVLNYEVVIKKAKIKYGEIDEIDVESYEFVPFDRFERTYTLDYLAPHDEIKIPVLYLTGEFSEAEVYVNSLYSDERRYFKQKILVDTFKHPELDRMQGSHQMRQMLGVYYKKDAE
ncbi:hypothetical protein [Sporosarcina sp. ZBG7A]|uniref:hypothetical protein n=1 Tax=Sporosarcina sp. ZBG7A TaxID=1582223 RepID=UPI00057ACBBE|nr:hypothetical protein [Sporosarcina sp. ZBG7A]